MSDSWHLSRGVMITVIVTLLGITGTLFLQTIYATHYFTKMESRIGVLEEKDPKQDARIFKLEEIGARVAVMEEKQNTMLDRMKIQTTTMQDILAIVSKINK